ncbi:IS110 family transposase [Leuconostoc pseudomesenteroides]|uniref:transposase n=1 Tax=Leuconostoc pseudomesenteroides TaxID=33968 RepID=UPI00403DCCA9
MSLPLLVFLNRLGSVILAKINHINNFQSPDQLLAFAGLEPSVYQSGETNATDKIVKRGSTSLRWALCAAAEYASSLVADFTSIPSKET